MNPKSATSSRFGSAVALGALVCLAVLLRAYNLGWPPLWVDEAESAINALTIVADGVPGDHFLGQPLYENTLVRPWPESPEYEFRDISYSDRGLAVYHGWLPLYAIAGAFRLAGVTPEQARHGTPLRDASPAEIRHWTAVPRLPSLLFSALFVVAVYGLGRTLHGAPVGWALAFAAATANAFVWFGRQARYYSATLAGNAACGLAIWNACRRGRMSDHALAGLAVGVLFHIHALSAVTMAALYVVTLPLARCQPRLWLRVLTAGIVGGFLVVPWAAWSGLLGHTAHIPAARHYVDLPLMLWSLPSTDPVMLATAGLGLAWFAAASFLGGRLRDRWRRPVVDGAASLYFAVAWVALSYLSFVALMPAASYFVDRLKLAVAVPGLLLNSLVIAAASRALRPSSRSLPVAGVGVLLVLAGQVPPRLVPERSDRAFGDLIGLVRSWRLAPGGRIFASPNDHLILTYYTGRPVQNIGPMRKAWMDRFAGDLVVIEGPWFERLESADVREAARRIGRELTPAEAEVRAADALRLATAIDLETSGAQVLPPPRTPDDLDRALIETVHRRSRRYMDRFVRSTPLGHLTAPSNWNGFRHSFFYWFSDPDRRAGAGLNWGACRNVARVYVHASGFVVFDCRKNPEPPLVPGGADLVRQP
jgi:hypothetical protein